MTVFEAAGAGSATARQLWLRRGLGLVGVAIVAIALARQVIFDSLGAVSATAMVLALVAWALLIFTRRTSATSAVLFGVMIVGGAISAPETNGLGIAATAVGVLFLAREPAVPFVRVVSFAVGGALLVFLSSLAANQLGLGLLAMECGIAVAFLGGQTRRQVVVAETQSRSLLESQVAVREELARADLLAARQQIAHDIHDVLAHSLGGLVIQLDAIDALLESGDAAAARTRIGDARALAADGLGDARRAVAALRESPLASRSVVDPLALLGVIEALLDAHRTLGGEAILVETGERRSLGEPLDTALGRALQESLTNARRHAPGVPVRVALEWTGHAVALTIDNAVPEASIPSDSRAAAAAAAATASVGGGNGLAGMRERFESLAGGTVTAGRIGDRFVVRVQGETA